MNSVVSIDSSGYQNDSFPSCMRYVGARFIQVTDGVANAFAQFSHTGELTCAFMRNVHGRLGF